MTPSITQDAINTGVTGLSLCDAICIHHYSMCPPCLGLGTYTHEIIFDDQYLRTVIATCGGSALPVWCTESGFDGNYPTAELARPEPDRAGVCQAQAPAAQSFRANCRRNMRRNRPRTRCLQPRGVRKLPQKFRLSNLIPSCFSITKRRAAHRRGRGCNPNLGKGCRKNTAAEGPDAFGVNSYSQVARTFRPRRK